MTHLDAIPLWAAIPAALLLVVGSGLTLLGAVGLLRLDSFYDRLHAPTLGTSWGAGGIVLASAVVFTALAGRLVVHELLIGLFIVVTTPVTTMILGRAALRRDRGEGSRLVPPAPAAAASAPADGLDQKPPPARAEQAGAAPVAPLSA